MAKAPQLAAIAIALALVVSAVGYGIVRGVLADDQKSQTATTWRSVAGCHAGEELPVDNSLLLPTQLPEGVCLCLTFNCRRGPPRPRCNEDQQGNNSSVNRSSELQSRHHSISRRPLVKLNTFARYIY